MKRHVGLLLLVVVGLIPACRSVKLVTPDPIAAGPSHAATRTAILDAAQNRSWVVTSESSGVVHATVLVNGKHELKVAVVYDDQQVRMDYEGSDNFDYRKSFGKEYIHTNAVRTMEQLWWDVQKRLSNARTASDTGSTG